MLKISVKLNLTPDQHAIACEMAKNGIKINDIADALKCSCHTIHRSINNYES
jgi:DNA invertase Pin-like site-specific DNA recombinase